MPVDTTKVLIGVGFAVAILILLALVMRPWARFTCKAPKSGPKRVAIDESQNATASDEGETPPTMQSSGAAPGAPEAPPTKDDIMRAGETAHRGDLMRGAATARRSALRAPTTAAMMMDALHTRSMPQEATGEAVAYMSRSGPPRSSDPFPYGASEVEAARV